MKPNLTHILLAALIATQVPAAITEAMRLNCYTLLTGDHHNSYSRINACSGNN